MDIGKYIGKFLIKNNYCSLSGLGVFELKKTPSNINSSEGNVTPPSYQISFTPVGSIDDSFASFIANSENVSISNSSNNIKEYCIKVKEELNHTGSFTIDHLGKLTMSNNKITFQQSSDLDFGYEPVSIPTVESKVSTTDIKPENGSKLDFSYPPAHPSYRGKSSGMSKIFLLALLGILILLGAYFSYDYYKNNATVRDIKTEQTPIEIPSTVDTLLHQDTTALASSNRPTTDSSTTSAPIAAPTAANAHIVAVFSFTTEAAAQAKATKLKNYGNLAAVTPINNEFIVTIEATHALNDTTLLVDSLRRFFNPKGNVYILK